MADCVVVGIDGSDAGERALEFSAKMANRLGDRLLVCHIIPWSPYAVRSAEENERRHRTRQEELTTAHREIVDPAVARLRSDGIEAEGVVRHGHPAETLCAVAGEHSAVHLVVGRRGQSRVLSLLFGSTAGNLLQLSTVPVTVVP